MPFTQMGRTAGQQIGEENKNWLKYWVSLLEDLYKDVAVGGVGSANIS